MHTQILSSRYWEMSGDQSFLRRIRSALETEGYFCLENFLARESLDRLRREVAELRKHASLAPGYGNHKYTVKDSAHLENTLIAQLTSSAYFLDLVNGILGAHEGYPSLLPEPITRENIKSGVTYLEESGSRTAFHFDDSYLNIIIPAVIPEREGRGRGHLTLYPNIRTLEPGFYNRIIVPFLCRTRLHKILFSSKHVDYIPGSLYVFFGYRSLHGVEALSEKGMRCITNVIVKLRKARRRR